MQEPFGADVHPIAYGVSSEQRVTGANDGVAESEQPENRSHHVVRRNGLRAIWRRVLAKRAESQCHTSTSLEERCFNCCRPRADTKLDGAVRACLTRLLFGAQ